MRVAIPPDLHPLVRKALRALKPDPRLSYRPELDDKLLRTPRGFIQIAVARDHTERAGRLLDTFIRTVEGPDVRGRVFFVEDKTILDVDGETFRFRFKEENATTPHRPTPEERREIAAHPHFHSVPKVDLNRPTASCSSCTIRTSAIATERGSRTANARHWSKLSRKSRRCFAVSFKRTETPRSSGSAEARVGRAAAARDGGARATRAGEGDTRRATRRCSRLARGVAAQGLRCRGASGTRPRR